MKAVWSPPRAWRLVFTGLSFALFGLGGLVLRLFCFPLVRLSCSDPLQQRRRSRLLIHWVFRFFVGFMHRTGVITWHISHPERLGKPGQMIVANHPSLIDVVLLIACIPDANCVVKEGLWRNPFTRGPVRAAGYISNDASVEMIENTAQALHEGQTLVIFPEGTRTSPGQMPKFHRGASAIAIRGAACITPVVIRVNPTTLTKAEPWYSIPARRVHFSLEVGEAIDPQVYAQNAPAPIASRKLDAHLHEYFVRELTQHERSAS